MSDTDLFRQHPTLERYELSSGAVCDVPYACRSADLAVLHGSADIEQVRRLLAGQRYRPVSIGDGRCLASLWLADYRDTSCGAYREWVLTFTASLDELEVPVRAPLELLQAAAHPQATLLVQRLVLDHQVPIEYGREVNGFNKYPVPQPVAIAFDDAFCDFDVRCEQDSIVAGRVALPQEPSPTQRVALGFVTGAAVFQSRGLFHFDMQARFRAVGDGDSIHVGRELRGLDYRPLLVQYMPDARFVMTKPLNWLGSIGAT